MSQEDITVADEPGQEPTPDGSQEPPNEPDPSTTPSGDGNDDDGMSKSDLKDALAEARREAAANRKRAKKAEDEAGELRSKQETEEQRREREAQEAKERADAAEAKVQKMALRVAVQDAAQAANAADSATIYALIMEDGIDIPFENDEPDREAVVAAVAQVMKDRPFLKANPAPAPDGGDGEGDPGRGQEPRKETLDERRQRVYHGQTKDIFDADQAEERGGGVVIGRGVVEGWPT